MQKNSPGSTKGSPHPVTLNPLSGLTRRLAALWPKRATRVVLAVVVAGLFAVSAAHAAPTSTLYMVDNTSGPPSQLWTVQGGTGVITSTPIGAWDEAIAVTNTIKTLGWDWGDTGLGVSGSQYTLSGVPTGTTYSNPLPGSIFFDGASDGTNNYSVDWNTGTVYKFNGSWANPTVLFTDNLGGAGDKGITYDTTNNTLWLDNTWNNELYHYTLNGTLISSFLLNPDVSGDYAYSGLALDPADHTLWVWDGINSLEQFSQNGVLLSSLFVSNTEQFQGMEFAEATPTPIPGALLLFGPGLAGLAFVRRRFGK